MLFVLFRGEIFGGNAVIKLTCTIALANCSPTGKNDVLLPDIDYKTDERSRSQTVHSKKNRWVLFFYSNTGLSLLGYFFHSWVVFVVPIRWVSYRSLFPPQNKTF